MNEFFSGCNLRIRTPSLTLNKTDIEQLWKIAEKAKDNNGQSDVILSIYGKREFINTKNIDTLINGRWPQDAEALDLVSKSTINSIDVSLEKYPRGSNNIEVSGEDVDWVSARVQELENYVARHRNWHWIFHNVPTLFTLSLVFAFLVGYGAALRFHLDFELAVMAGAVGYAVAMSIVQPLRDLYPYTLIDSGINAGRSKMRAILNWFMGGLILTLIINAITALI